jgi:predicted transcriptional regulator
VIKGTSTLNRPQNLLRKLIGMDGLTRARAIKAGIKGNIAVLQSPEKASGNKHQVESDPEDALIKTLREEQGMSWTDIANFLNQEHRDRGEPAIFTDAAVYSRFVRSVPRIAVPVNEIGFDPKDYKYLQNPAQFTKAEGSGTISKAGKKRVKSFDNAKELESNMRKLVKDNEHVELETAEKTEQLMQAVAKVERNFWVLVADEMERATTKLYPPDALASRYHAV